MSGRWETAGMVATKRFLAKIWTDECGISSVEYAMLLAFIAAGIMTAAEMLSNAVSNELEDTAALLDDDGGAANCGDSGGEGAGSGNTCK